MTSPQSDVSKELKQILDNHAFNYYDIQARYQYQTPKMTAEELELQIKMLNNLNEQALLNLIEREKLDARIDEIFSSYGTLRVESLKAMKGQSDE